MPGQVGDLPHKTGNLFTMHNLSDLGDEMMLPASLADKNPTAAD
jgi:hypothetical protein